MNNFTHTYLTVISEKKKINEAYPTAKQQASMIPPPGPEMVFDPEEVAQADKRRKEARLDAMNASDDNDPTLLAAKATRLAFKTNKPEDHEAAVAAHIKARGREFEPQPTKDSNAQPLIDKWRHHDKQIKMHQAALESLKESLEESSISPSDVFVITRNEVPYKVFKSQKMADKTIAKLEKDQASQDWSYQMLDFDESEVETESIEEDTKSDIANQQMANIEKIRTLLEQAQNIAEQINKTDQNNKDYLYNVRIGSEQLQKKLRAILNYEVDVIYKSIQTQLQ